MISAASCGAHLPNMALYVHGIVRFDPFPSWQNLQTRWHSVTLEVAPTACNVVVAFPRRLNVFITIGFPQSDTMYLFNVFLFHPLHSHDMCICLTRFACIPLELVSNIRTLSHFPSLKNHSRCVFFCQAHLGPTQCSRGDRNAATSQCTGCRAL